MDLTEPGKFINTEDDAVSSWLQFLLFEDLLEIHLKSNNSDLNYAASLISTFLHQADLTTGILKDIRVSENCCDVESTEMFENDKIRCLKLLAIKTASYMSWDLDYLMKFLPANVLHMLLTHLIQLVAREDLLKVPAKCMNMENMDPVALFAINLYYCWSLRLIVNESLPSRPSKVSHVQIPGFFETSFNLSATKDALLKMLQEKEEEAIAILETVVSLRNGCCRMPVVKCFVVQLKRGAKCNWSFCQEVSIAELTCQASYSLGCLYFLKKRYELAMTSFRKCKILLKEVSSPAFMKINVAKLGGYLEACNGILKVPINVCQSVYEKVNESVCNNLQGLTDLLLTDIIKQELSLAIRYILEEWALISQRQDSLYEEVLVCNTLRRVLGNKLSCLQLMKSINSTIGLVEFFIRVCSEVYIKVSNHLLKDFLSYMTVTSCETLNLSQHIMSSPLKNLFSTNELQQFLDYCHLSFTPDSSLMLIPEESEDIKIANLEQELLTCYEANRINDIINCLIGKVPKYNLFYLSDKWRLSKELFQTLETISISQCHLAIIFHILISKARISLQIQLQSLAKELLEHVEMKLRDTTMYKLMKLLKWEVLRADLSVAFQHPLEFFNQDLINRSKNCISSLHLESDLQPSLDSLKLSVLHLLDMEEWEFLISISSGNELVQFGQMIGALCKEIIQLKTVRALARNFIEFVALIFPPPSKRPLTGVISQDCFLDFVSIITNETVLSVLISCLTKLLRFADQNMNGDIFSDFVVFWPSAINNTMLDRGTILDAVYCILSRSMIINNQNISWIRTLADLSFALKQYHSAMKYYVYLGLIGTDYFLEPITKNVHDDQVYRKMIQICVHLSLFTQAALLCQFLDEVDYSTAFKCLQERSNSDAMDFHYSCIWDIAILEFIINMHQKNGEVDKMDLALKIVSQAELNTNNRTEVLLESIRATKGLFLRKLALQFFGLVGYQSVF